MKLGGFPTLSLFQAAVAPRAAQSPGAPDPRLGRRQESTSPAGSAQAAAALAPAGPALAFTSILDALLNEQSSHGAVVYGANGTPDLMASILAGQPKANAPVAATGSGAGYQFISHADDGSTDAASLLGYSDDEVAADLIRQAGSNGELSLADVLNKMQIDARTDAGAAVAETVSEAWSRLSHGHASMSATELASAIHSYRLGNGDEIGPGGMASLKILM